MEIFKKSISSFCAVVNDEDWDDLNVLLKSISIYNPFIPIFLYVSEVIKSKLIASDISDGRISIKLNINCNLDIDYHTQMCDIIEIALTHTKNTCFVKPSTVFISDIRNININIHDSNTIAFIETDSIKLPAVVNKNNIDIMFIYDIKFVEMLRFTTLTLLINTQSNNVQINKLKSCYINFENIVYYDYDDNGNLNFDKDHCNNIGKMLIDKIMLITYFNRNSDRKKNNENVYYDKYIKRLCAFYLDH